MKTLDEVIETAPYIGTEWTNDALHYLQEYRVVTDICHKHGIASVWGQVLPDPEKTDWDKKLNFDNAYDNDPLDWETLKTMEGKPVWVEEKYSFSKEWHGGWEVICTVWDNEFDDDPYLSMTDEEYRHKDDMGEHWQAYRKERS